MKGYIYYVYVFLLVLSSLAGEKKIFSQAPDSVKMGAPAPDTAKISKPSEPKKESHSVIAMEYVKEKVEHSPDSAFFNILKVTNHNGKAIQGVVRVTAPVGWKVISEEETIVNIEPDESTYIPVRVSLARTANGGVSYVINATLYSNRTLFPDKNQTSISKACYITIPKKVKWDMYPVTRQVYFDRYTQSSSLKLKMNNQGNGSQVVKLEFDIGTSLVMDGALGKKHFLSVELKPHTDTVLSFPVKYIPPDESSLWDRDFSKLTIKVNAVSDTITQKASVSFKYLESSFYNTLFNKLTPLTIEVQMQNLLSEADPRMLFGAWGYVWLKNDHTIDYNVRIPGISFTRYKDASEFGTYLWQRSRMLVQYKAGKWEVRAGDITSNGSMGLITAFGRGISGTYDITDKHRVGGAVAATVANRIYSGNLNYVTKALPRGIILGSSLTFIADNYNKLNIFGGDVSTAIPLFAGHSINAALGVTQTQHNYDNQTFFDALGNPIITNDPSKSFLGFGARAGYMIDRRKFKSSLFGTYSTPHFSQYFGSRLMVNGAADYYVNKKYFFVFSSNLTFQDPQIYTLGILIPENNYLAGRHKVELADKINSRLTLYCGPFIEHLSQKRLKIDANGDSVSTRFKTYSPRLSLRLNYKTGISGYVSPYFMPGYTYVTSAEDTTIGIPSPFAKNVYYNAKAGLNVIQNNWGLNVFYYYGPHDLVTQSDYYYFNHYSKSIRIMPYFQKYYFNKLLLVSSYNSYYYEVISSTERLALNARFNFNFENNWTLFVDNNLYAFSRISSDGGKIFSRSYYLNIGFRKSFDIPQPRVKYYDLKIVCFKDVNGNKIQDENEQGIPDIVIAIDRTVETDSVTGKSIRRPGQFVPIEMVTDNFGHVAYYHIPEGECKLNIVPLMNLADLYNVNGQKQKVSVARDTTYYIPFVQSYRVTGRVIVNRDEYSSVGAISVSNIRITATDSLGNSFPTLTGSDGYYTLYVPQAGTYKVTINQVLGEHFFLQESEYEVSFDGAKDFRVDFIFNEKKRKININGASGSLPVTNDTIKTPQGSYLVIGNDTIKGITMIRDTIVSEKTPNTTDAGASTLSGTQQGGQPSKQTYLIPVGPGITYRIQLAATSTRIPRSQYAAKFKGVSVSEYSEGNVYKYTAGDVPTIEEAKKLKEVLRSQGYSDAFLVPFYKGTRVKY